MLYREVKLFDRYAKELESVDKGFSIKRVLEVSQDIPNSQNVILTYQNMKNKRIYINKINHYQRITTTKI